MKYQAISKNLFEHNRTLFTAQLSTQSLAIFCSNDQMPTNADGTMPFKQNSDLFWLSGVDQEELKKLCENKTPSFPEKHQAAYIFSTELLQKNLVSDETYNRAATFFTDEQLVALVSTIGYYCLISHTLNAFNIPLEENMDEPFN